MRPSKYGKVIQESEGLSYADRKLRSMACASWVTTALLVGFGATVVVLLAVMNATGVFEQTNRMTQSTIDMGDRSAKAEHDIKALGQEFLSRFPPNQIETTARQGLELVANAARISGKMATLLETMDPAIIPAALRHLEVISGKVQDVVSRISQDEITRIMLSINHAQELFASITPEHIQKLVDGVGELSVHVGALSKQAEAQHSVEKATLLIDQLRLLGERANQLSQIKIGWESLVSSDTSPKINP